MKKILLTSLIFFILACILFRRGKQEPLYVSPEKLPETIRAPSVTESKILEQIFLINLKNSNLESIVYENLEIRTSERPNFRLRGFIAYKKHKNFRMTIHSFLGQESDIGSNSKCFWFWSKRMNPPALYWATHENVHKTRLRTPFNPMWAMESLGVNAISPVWLLKHVEISEQGKFFKIIRHTKGMQGRPVMKITLLDPQQNAIVGNYLHNYKELIVSTEIKEFYFLNGLTVPKRIVVTWHEENIQIEWKLSLPKINYNISEELWEKPYRSLQIDMGK